MARKIKFNITEAHSGAAFTVKVITRAAQNEIAGVEDGTLRVRLTSASAEEANQELINFLAEVLEVTPKQLEIVAGASARDKLISVEGVSPTRLNEIFESGDE